MNNILNITAFIGTLLTASSVAAGNAAPRDSLSVFISQTTEQEWIEGATVGFLAVKGCNDTIACLNHNKMLIPASTMKALTTGAALHSMGEDYRFSTGIGYSGSISDGILHGNLYIIGGGDPLLGSRSETAIPIEKTFAQWKSMLGKAGIRTIDGDIVGDDRYFDPCAETGSWQWDDIGTYYGTGTSGLSFNENMQSINISPGEYPGAPLKIEIIYPELPWMEYRFPCITGKPGSGNSIYLYTSPLSPVGELRGSYAIDRSKRTEKVSNKFPAYTCAFYFKRYLESSGITCRGKAADLGNVFGIEESERTPSDSLTVIGSTLSPPLSEIAGRTNRESNNMLAETIFKAIGKEYCGKSSYDSSQVALSGIAGEIGADTSRGCRIADGSGLSRQNSLSPAFMTGFLRAMMDSPAFGCYAESLPSPGEDGTLYNVMRQYPESAKARIKMKSGSMTGVQCYCGYIIPTSGAKDDTIVFSIMVNGYFESPSRLRTFIDRLLYLTALQN